MLIYIILQVKSEIDPEPTDLYKSSMELTKWPLARAKRFYLFFESKLCLSKLNSRNPIDNLICVISEFHHKTLANNICCDNNGL